MVVSENEPESNTPKTIVFLFLPRTLVVRLTVLGFAFGAISAMVPYGIEVPFGLTTLVLFVWAFTVAVRNSLKDKGRKRTSLFRTLAVTAGIAVAYLAIRYLGRLLAYMASDGSGRISFGLGTISPGSLGGVETFLILVTVVVLVWIPQVFFMIQLDVNGTGDAQHVLLGLITAASCAMTGICFFLGHFDDGPLHTVSMGALIVGIIGVMLLVAPPYRSLAKTCWQRGFAGVFSVRVLKQRWSNMAKELRKALDYAGDRDMTHSSASDPAALPVKED